MMEVYNRLIDNPLIREKLVLLMTMVKLNIALNFMKYQKLWILPNLSLSLITFLVHKLTLILPTTKLYQFGLIIKLTLKAWIE